MTGNSMQIIEWLMSQRDKEQIYEIDAKKNKRSLDSNAYFWVLVNKVAKALNISDAEVHDKIIAENINYFHNADGAIDWKVSAEKPNSFGLIKEVGTDTNYYLDSGMDVKLQKDNGDCCKSSDGAEIKGNVYWHIKGTHQMTSKEISRCIESIKVEAQELGIETMPQAELDRLLNAWGKKYDGKNQ